MSDKENGSITGAQVANNALKLAAAAYVIKSCSEAKASDIVQIGLWTAGFLVVAMGINGVVPLEEALTERKANKLTLATKENLEKNPSNSAVRTAFQSISPLLGECVKTAVADAFVTTTYRNRCNDFLFCKKIEISQVQAAQNQYTDYVANNLEKCTALVQSDATKGSLDEASARTAFSWAKNTSLAPINADLKNGKMTVDFELRHPSPTQY